MEEHLSVDSFSALLGLQVEEARVDFCRLRMPFRPDLRTTAEVVHGGAIASLIDTAAVVAVWSNVDADTTRGATASLTVNYLAASGREDLIANAQVIRRGRSVVFVDVDVFALRGERIAKGVVTYKLGRGGK
ncbi:MAG: PaaI family thioesterase [Deltaproteobacteria bacterium]|nr:PaaI family thioesterase [Deltaproteobacteria bacterium]